MHFQAVFCILLLLTCTGVSFGQQLLLPERMDIKVGENLVITPISIPDSSRLVSKWICNGITFLTETQSGIIIQPPYTDRASLNTNTLALTLKSLTESDSGQYALEVVTVTATNSSVTSVQVFVPVSNVTILPSQTELVEFNSTVSLRCSASGSFLTFVWQNRSSEVTADDRVQLTDSNSSLTINNVTRDDRGPYYCNVFNSVSNATSPSMKLTIHYGPENVAVKADPVEPIYRAGSKVILTCSAESSPAAEFQWAVNGAALGQMGHELIMNNIHSSQSGNYTCIAHNTKSLRYSTSQPISITVLAGGAESLSAGAITGIVIGVLLGVAGISGLIFYFTKAKKLPRTVSKGNTQNTATVNEYEQDEYYVNFPNNQSGVHTGGSQPDGGRVYETVLYEQTSVHG